MEGIAHGELAHIELAQQDSPCILELGHHRGVIVGHVILENGRASGGENAIGAELVFDCYRDSVQRPSVLSGGDFALGLPGFGARLLGGNGDVGVESRVHLLNTS